jgi:NADH dehydrogenase FAD-containing subunit
MDNAPAHPTPHVVIVGGGFAGLWATRALARDRVRITLVDRRNHHLFQPLLYQVATAGTVGTRHCRAAAPYPARATQCGSAPG